jgi:hypothetical protein
VSAVRSLSAECPQCVSNFVRSVRSVSAKICPQSANLVMHDKVHLLVSTYIHIFGHIRKLGLLLATDKPFEFEQTSSSSSSLLWTKKSLSQKQKSITNATMMAAYVQPPLPLLPIKRSLLWSGNLACGDVIATTDAVPDLSLSRSFWSKEPPGLVPSHRFPATSDNPSSSSSSSASLAAPSIGEFACLYRSRWN